MVSRMARLLINANIVLASQMNASRARKKFIEAVLFKDLFTLSLDTFVFPAFYSRVGVGSYSCLRGKLIFLPFRVGSFSQI